VGRSNVRSEQSFFAKEEESNSKMAKTELEAQLFLAEVFEDRRKNPKEDLWSAMVHAHGDDEEPLLCTNYKT
jgi:Cytochrome P450